YESFMTKFWPPVPSVPPTQEEINTQNAWTHFAPWVLDNAKRQQAIQFLSALTVVLDFEANRPYKYWYDEMGKLELERLNQNRPMPNYVNVQVILRECATGDLTKEKINAYLTE